MLTESQEQRSTNHLPGNKIVTMTKKSCIFCKIVNKEIPSYKIYEEKDYLAILDISQFTEGHTIVIPKEHIEFVWDIKEHNKYFSVVQKVANHLRSLGFKYVDSMIFGRKVRHAHVHLIPHNGEINDYKKACKEIGLMQEDITRRPTPQCAEKIVEKFKLV